MPACVECGVETPRADMFGLKGDLRCSACATKRRRVYTRPARPRFPTRQPVVALTVVAAAVVVTTLTGHTGENLISVLGSRPDAVWDGQLWRLLTTVLPHGGGMHLLFNCYWLWYFGAVLEDALGSLRFTGLLCLLAVGAGASQFLYTPGVAIGLSGVVYGLAGYLFALRRDKDYAAMVMTKQTCTMLGAWLLICLFATRFMGMPVANLAHIGGALFGWLAGTATLAKRRYAAFAGLTAFCAALALTTLYMPWTAEYCYYRFQKSLAAGEVDDANRWMKQAMDLRPMKPRREGRIPNPLEPQFPVPEDGG